MRQFNIARQYRIQDVYLMPEPFANRAYQCNKLAIAVSYLSLSRFLYEINTSRLHRLCYPQI